MAKELDGTIESLKEANRLFTDLSTSLSRTMRLNIDFKGIDESSISMSNLERNISNVAKVNGKLSENWDKLSKSQKQISDSLNSNNQKWEENSKQIDENEKSVERLSRLREQEIKNIVSLSEKINKLDEKSEGFKETLADLEKQQVESEKAHADFSSQVISLNKANEKLYDSNGDVLISNIKLKKAAEELDTPFQVLIKTLGKQALDALDKFAKGLMAIGLAILALPFTALFDGLKKYWDYLNKVMELNSRFNQSIGPTTEGLDEMRSKAWEVDGTLMGLGESMGAGLDLYAETAHAVGFVGGEFDKVTKNAALAGRALGIGGTAAGELTHTMIQLGTTAKGAQHDLVEISKAANMAGVPVSDFGKELVSAKNVLASFGNTGKQVFMNAAAYAKRLGVSIQSLTKFMDMTDTFDKTAESAAKLNTVFGTNINALDMMLEQDPSKRMEAVRSAMKAQGKSFESLNRQERKFFADSVGMSEEEAAGFLNSKMTLEKFQKEQAKAKQKQASDEKTIRDGLAKTAKTLLSMEQVFVKIMRAAAPLFDMFLDAAGLGKGFSKITENVEVLTSFIERLFKKLSENENVKSFLKEIGSLFGDIFGTLKKSASEDAASNLADGIGNFAKSLKEGVVWAREIFNKYFTEENISKVTSAFGFLADNFVTIAGALLAFQGITTILSALPGILAIAEVLGFVGGTAGAAAGGATLGATIMGGLSAAMTALSTVALPLVLLFAALYGAFEIIESDFMGIGTMLREVFGDVVKHVGAIFNSFYEAFIMPTFKIIKFFAKVIAGVLGFVLSGLALFAGLAIEPVLWVIEKFLGFFVWVKDKVASLIPKSIIDFVDGPEEKREAKKEEKAAVTPERVGESKPPAIPSQMLEGKVSLKNFAEKGKKETANKGETTLIAGDVYLDGNLVGRHLLRGATSQ